MMTALKAECTTCPLHEQFEKRLDERWTSHSEDQKEVEKVIFAKLDKVDLRVGLVDEKVSKVGNRVTLMVGAALVGWPILQYLASKFFDHVAK